MFLNLKFQSNILATVGLLFLIYALYDSFYLYHLKMPDELLTSDVLHNRGMYDGWVWAVKPERKTSDRVRVEIAHAAPGPEGAFQIVAYADTEGDGLPDTEIARSELLSADQAGLWSAFEFITAEENIYVGNAWPDADYVAIYRRSGEWPVRNSPLSARFYHSLPPRRPSSAGPAFTNLRISFPK